MLSTRGFRQPVDRVVGEFGARLDSLVAEKNRLLGIVADFGDVANRIIGVGEVLHLAAWPLLGWRLWTIVGKRRGIPGSEQTRKPECQWIIIVIGCDSVAVIDPYALAFGIIVYICDERCRCRPVQVDINRFKKIGLVECRAVDALIGCGHLDSTVERVIDSRAGERLIF